LWPNPELPSPAPSAGHLLLFFEQTVRCLQLIHLWHGAPDGVPPHLEWSRETGREKKVGTFLMGKNGETKKLLKEFNWNQRKRLAD